MKIKLNWGTGIAVFYSLFVIVILINVVYISGEKFDLVEENYYDKELKYQSQIDKINRAKLLPEKLFISNNGGKAILQFPRILSAPISGVITLYRPSDASMDKKYKIELNDKFQHVIDVSRMSKGHWELKIDWAAGDSLYYNNEELYIN